MKGLKTGLSVVGIGVLGVGIALAITNPDERAYTAYASAELTEYVRGNACANVNDLLRSQCNQLLNQFLTENQGQIQQLIASRTDRQNFLVFSQYSTTLSADSLLPPLLSQFVPSYYFETAAVFNRFYIYKAERQ